MSGGPKLVQGKPVEPPSSAGAEPRFDWADQLMGEMHEYLLRCALHHVRNRGGAEELAQAILAKLWMDYGRDMLWCETEPLKVYLGTVVHRRSVDLKRRKRTRESYEEEYRNGLEHHPSAWHTSAEREQADRELGESIQAAVNSLPPATREIYTLYLSGLPHKDIAARLGVTTNHTTKTVALAGARVRAKLADWAPASYTAEADAAPRKRGRPRLSSSGKRDDT